MKKIFIIKSELITLFILAVISFVVFNSCQDDLPIDPVLSMSGRVTGTVIDKTTLDSIPDAIIRIYRIGTNEKYTTKTDKLGNFIVPIPVLPEKTPFRVTIDKPGYKTADTTIYCACDIYDLKLIPLSFSVCGITCSPDTLYFNNTTLGAYRNSVATIKNNFLIPVSITGIEFSNPHFKLSSKSQQPTFVLKGLQTSTIEVEYTPTSLGTVYGEMKIKTDCSSNSENIIYLVGNAITAPCAIVLSDTTNKMLGNPPRRIMDYFVNKTCTVTVFNNDTTGQVSMLATYSLIAQPPTTQILLDTSNVLTVSPSSPVTIPSGQSRNIVITVSSIVVGDVFALFSLTTSPGGCIIDLPLWVQFYEPGYSPGTLYRWSEQQGVVTNPFGVYKGFDFQDSTLKDDKNGICSGDSYPVQLGTTDFRFDGIVIQGNEYFAKLKSYAGIQLLGNVAPGGPDQGYYFEKSIWMPRVNLNPSFVWDNGCGNSLYKEGDIIAVRFRDFSTYGLIRIDRIWFTPENFEQLDFSFIRIN